jgi:hypothetical protein
LAQEEVPKGAVNQINIELSDEVAEGVYSNLAIISHSNAEFVVDFIRVLPGLPKAKVKSRIILSPQHAKRLLFALQDNIMKYERSHGPIDLPEGDAGLTLLPPGFAGGQPGMA